MVASALIGSSFSESLGEAIKNGGLPSGDLVFEIFFVTLQEIKIDSVLFKSPASCDDSTHVDRKPNYFILVKFGLIGLF